MSEVDLEDVETAMLRNAEPVVTAGELAEELPCSSRHVLDLLRLLERAGAVESKQTGARAVAWWHVERVHPPQVPPEEHPAQASLDDSTGLVDFSEQLEHPGEIDFEERLAQREQPDVDDHQEESDDVESDDDLADALEDVDFPSSRTRDECIEVVHAAREYLRDVSSASMRDFVNDVLPEHPIGYEVVTVDEGERYRGAWWRKVVRPGLEAAPGVRRRGNEFVLEE